MTNYPEELKQKIINDMSPPNSLKLPELVTKYNVPKQTLYHWRKKAEYCRNKDIYLKQFEQWHAACLAGFNSTPVLNAKQKAEHIQKDKQIKQLEKSLTAKRKR